MGFPVRKNHSRGGKWGSLLGKTTAEELEEECSSDWNSATSKQTF